MKMIEVLKEKVNKFFKRNIEYETNTGGNQQIALFQNVKETKKTQTDEGNEYIWPKDGSTRNKESTNWGNSVS